MNQHIRDWQQRPEPRQYYTPTPTTYYEQVSTVDRSIGVAGVLGFIAANGVLAWAEWSAHEVCVHGNAYSVVAEIIVGGLAAISTTVAVVGYRSHTDIGAKTASVLAPISLILAGFGVILWSPTWPAALAASLMHGAVCGLFLGLHIAWQWVWRRMRHQAGMQHDQNSADLQKNHDTQTHETTRAAIRYQAVVDGGIDADRRADQAQYELHLRHPDVVPPPARYALPESPAHRTVIVPSETVPGADDLMDLAGHFVTDPLENDS